MDLSWDIRQRCMHIPEMNTSLLNPTRSKHSTDDLHMPCLNCTRRSAHVRRLVRIRVLYIYAMITVCLSAYALMQIRLFLEFYGLYTKLFLRFRIPEHLSILRYL